MKQIEFSPGTSIDEAAIRLCETAEAHSEATGTFNGVELHAVAGYAPAAVAKYYDEEQHRRGVAYRNSREGRKAAQDAEDRRAAAQAKHDALMRQLPTLNMADDAAVLAWLCDMQDQSDHSGVIVRRQTIVEKFEKAGYAAGANCGKDYRMGDRDNMFRYLVGQALDGLKNGPAIHPILHKFAAEWREQFGAR